MKKYGSTRTNLTLTAKAQKVYDSTDPCTIIELETEDGFLYDIDIAGDTVHGITEAQVNEMLEAYDLEDAE